MNKLKNEHLAFFMTFLIPGAGHFYAGRKLKAAILAISIMGLFVAGIYLNGVIFPVSDNTGFSSSLPAYQLIVDRWANYLLYVVHFLTFIPAVLVYGANLAIGDSAARFSEIGNTFLLLAGMLNLIAMFSAADTAREQNFITEHPDEWKILCQEADNQNNPRDEESTNE